jgi:hypothetical protein
MTKPKILGGRPVAALLLALVAVSTAGLLAQKPSLAELAKKEEARRKSLKVSGKVYSDGDVRPAPAPAPAATGTAPTPVEQKPATPPKQEEQKDEAWWRGRMQQAQEDLRRSEIFGDALQSRINALTTDFVNRDDPFQRAKIGEDRQKAVAELDRVKGDIDKFKKQIADITEEARQAGVPPGWIR